jgi:adenylyltransferase/sulfurtransferase
MTPDKLRRYQRQLVLPEVGVSGQDRLNKSSVLCVGLGGLGSSASLYLAAAGVGQIGLVDSDCVDESNLHRQVLHEERGIGTQKTVSAAHRLRGLNSLVTYVEIPDHITEENVQSILSPYDVVIDGSDNFLTRYVLNDACVRLRKPLVSAAVYRMEGQIGVFNFQEGPCYRCLFPAPGSDGNCDTSGVLGVVPGVIGVLQATEAIKILLGLPGVLSGRFLLVDLATMSFRTVRVRKSRTCGCVTGKFEAPRVLKSMLAI